MYAPIAGLVTCDCLSKYSALNEPLMLERMNAGLVYNGTEIGNGFWVL